MSMTKGGKVGINTSTPDKSLDVIGNVEIRNDLYEPALYLIQSNNETIAQIYGSNQLGITMLQGGRVGINTMSPNRSLDVIGNVEINNQLEGPGFYLRHTGDSNVFQVHDDMAIIMSMTK